MLDYYTLGPTPPEESCAQVGSDRYDYQHITRRECNARKHQLERAFPELSNSKCFLRVKSFPHDFGAYWEVVVYFNEDNNEEVELANRIESDCPTRWDNEARRELGVDYFLLVSLTGTQ